MSLEDANVRKLTLSVSVKMTLKKVALNYLKKHFFCIKK